MLYDAEQGIERADRRLESFNHGWHVFAPDQLARQTWPIAAYGMRLDVARRQVHLLQLAAREHRRLIVVKGRVGAVALTVGENGVGVRRVGELHGEDPAVAALRGALAIGLIAEPENAEAAEVAVAAADGDVDAADADECVRGYVVAWFAGGQGEIANLAVDESARGRGIGSALLDAALDEARGHGTEEVFLEVRSSNLRARELYASRGFTEVGRRRRYYRRPVEDAIILRWTEPAIVNPVSDR